jgi:TolA-binding protein
MKPVSGRMTPLAMAVLALVLLIACGDRQETKSPAPQVSGSDVKEEAQEAVETAGAFTQQKMDEYLQALDTQMNEWQQQIADLQARAEAKAGELSEESKEALDRQIATLQAKQQAAAEKFAELKSSSAEAWGELKEGMDSAMEDLSQAFNDAQAQLGESGY